MKAAVHPLREITAGVERQRRSVVGREGLTGKAEVTFVARGLAG